MGIPSPLPPPGLPRAPFYGMERVRYTTLAGEAGAGERVLAEWFRQGRLIACEVFDAPLPGVKILNAATKFPTLVRA